ncbi:hypothetical protein EB796_023914 [Bugula neritina]|uniref:Uncharacterized protein n=1 Tax=Bugula neritina TaxID=10212 RepID=A0A7J7IWI2_BUGNE|nr:hypothetical protein EB796_023914 [Bugula neritina]
MPEESIRAAAIRSVEERLALLELRWVPSGENGEPGLRFSEECLRKATRREQQTMPLVTWKFELSVSANSVERNYYQEYSDSNVNPNLIL